MASPDHEAFTEFCGLPGTNTSILLSARSPGGGAGVVLNKSARKLVPHERRPRPRDRGRRQLLGGAVAALRLGEAVVDTVVLERGRRWAITDPTRNTIFSTFKNMDRRAEWMNAVSKTPLYEGKTIGRYAGVLEVIPGKELTLLVGAGIGGGSLAYGGE